MQLLLFAHRAEAATFLSKLQLLAHPVFSHFSINSNKSIGLLLTGQGKENSLSRFKQLLEQLPSDCVKEVINLGTCGQLTKEKNKALTKSFAIHQCHCLNENPILLDQLATINCITSDRPIEGEQQAAMLSTIAEVVDMELYSLARLAKDYQIPIRSIKTVSDFADAPHDIQKMRSMASVWSKNLFDYYDQNFKVQRQNEE